MKTDPLAFTITKDFKDIDPSAVFIAPLSAISPRFTELIAKVRGLAHAERRRGEASELALAALELADELEKALKASGAPR